MPPNVVDLIPWRRGLQLPKLRLHQVNARLSHWYLQTKSSHLCTKKIWRLVTDPQKKNTWSCCRISRSKNYAYTCHLPVPAHRLDLIPQARASNLHIETDKLNTIVFKRGRAPTGNNKQMGRGTTFTYKFPQCGDLGTPEHFARWPQQHVSCRSPASGTPHASPVLCTADACNSPPRKEQARTS